MMKSTRKGAFFMRDVLKAVPYEAIGRRALLSDERSAGGPGEGEPSDLGSPGRLSSCTVNGTFSFRRVERRMWGWNGGF